MNDWTFDRDAIRVFRFVRCEFDAQTGIAQLAYAFDDGPELVETVVVPGAPFELDAARAAAAERALRLLHLVAGVSYYKAAVSREIRIDGYAIDADHRLTFIAHEVYLPKPKLSISGPGGIQATFEWQAAKATSVARMFTVELVNDVTSY